MDTALGALREGVLYDLWAASMTTTCAR